MRIQPGARRLKLMRTTLALALSLLATGAWLPAEGWAAENRQPINLTQALALARSGAPELRSAKAALDAAAQDLAIARRDAGWQVSIGTVSSPWSLSGGRQSMGDLATSGMAAGGSDQDFSSGAGPDFTGFTLQGGVQATRFLPTGGTLTLAGSMLTARERGEGGLEYDSSSLIMRVTEPLLRDRALEGPRPAIHAAEREYRRKELQLLLAERDTRLRVYRAYLDLALEQHAEKVAGEFIRLYEHNLALVERRRSIGNAGELDVLAAEYELARARQSLAESALARESKARDLALQLGWPEPAAPPVVELPGFTPEEYASANYEKAGSDPEALLARLAVEDAQAGLALARARLGARADVIAEVDDDGHWSAGVAVSYGLTEQTTHRMKVDQAEKAVAEGERAHQDTIRRLTDKIRLDYQAYRLAREAVRLAELGLKRAEEGRRLTELRFGDGAATQKEQLEALDDLRRADVERQGAVNRYVLALAQFKADLNLLPWPDA